MFFFAMLQVFAEDLPSSHLEGVLAVDTQAFPYEVEPNQPMDVQISSLYVNDTLVALDSFKPSSYYGLQMAIDGLPEDATFDAESRRFHWTPSWKDIGIHNLTLRVSNGSSENAQTVSVTVSSEKSSYLLPGVGYSMYLPEGDQFWQGVGVQYMIGNWVYQNNNPGPSHGRLYLDISLMKEQKTEDRILTWLLGVDLSLERLPRRRFLLPSFGLEFGGLSRENIGTQMIVVPTGGLHFWWTNTVSTSVDAGWIVPTEFKENADYMGLRLRAAVDVAFW